MRYGKRFLALILVVLLTLVLIPAAEAASAELPKNGDFVIRIDGGYVSEHTETVGGQDCLRVDLFLEGVTGERKLSSISFKLLYDPDQLTYVKNKPLSGNGVMSIVNPNEPGLLQYAFISSSGATLDGATPLLTLWFKVGDGLPSGTQIRFAFAEAIKADSVSAESYSSEKRTVGAQLKPFGIGPIFGDANCDCLVTAADAAFVLRALVGLETFSAQGLENAKVNGQPSVSAEDAVLILRYVVKRIERFPAEE